MGCRWCHRRPGVSTRCSPVLTARFADFARQSAAGYGLAAARIAVVPIGGVAEDLIAARARAAIEQVIGLLAKEG